MALDKSEDVDVIYLDLSKAFDHVPHKRLLKKLWGYGSKRTQSQKQCNSFRIKSCQKWCATGLCFMVYSFPG